MRQKTMTFGINDVKPSMACLDVPCLNKSVCEGDF